MNMRGKIKKEKRRGERMGRRKAIRTLEFCTLWGLISLSKVCWELDFSRLPVYDIFNEGTSAE